MIKVLIADIDTDTIRNFKTFLRTSFPDFKVVYAISDNSKDIFAVIKEYSPQLIIADIRFFGASHFTIIRDIYEKYPFIRFILYGLYNDGEYMKRCSEFGLIDFMYKPVKPSDLTRCLNTALERYKREDEKKKSELEIFNNYKEKRHIYEQIFLNNLISGAVTNKFELESAFKYYNITPASNYCVCVLRIDHFKKIILTLDEQEKHLLIYKISLIAGENLKANSAVRFINNFNSIVLILRNESKLENIISLCEKIKDEIYSKLQIRITIGIGRTYDSITDIAVSFKEADAALRYRFYLGHNTVIAIDFVEPLNKITYRYPLDKEKRLVYTAVIGEYNYCRALLFDLIKSLRESGPLPEKLLSKIVMDIIISINRYLTELNSPLQNEFMSFFPSKDILEMKDLDNAFEYLDSKLENFCKHVVATNEEKKKAIYDSIKSYINEKFHEQFSLGKIAFEMKTTSEYINQIFMENEKKPLFEYVVGVRIDNAKKIMKETPFDDDLVALKVGYDDARHFRSLFRQYTGMNTNDYRNSL